MTSDLKKEKGMYSSLLKKFRNNMSGGIPADFSEAPGLESNLSGSKQSLADGSSRDILRDSNSTDSPGASTSRKNDESKIRNSKSALKQITKTASSLLLAGEELQDDTASKSSLSLAESVKIGIIQDAPKDKDEVSKTLLRFRNRFPSIIEPYIDIFSCALERDILWQGRIYVTSTAICFYAKIFRNELKNIILFEHILQIEKAVTAGIFSNAIRIYTQESKFFFASFLKRDFVFEMICGLWHESLNRLPNGGSGFERPKLLREASKSGRIAKVKRESIVRVPEIAKPEQPKYDYKLIRVVLLTVVTMLIIRIITVVPISRMENYVQSFSIDFIKSRKEFHNAAFKELEKQYQDYITKLT